jgi:maltose alpha-D-glucosyltransferase/alpha-amylase
MPDDRHWYRTAVFYEVLARSFGDADGDGVGDLRGLRDRLEYLEWLGVDCLWLPPIFDSPLRDGGYDVRDYYAVHPDVGTVDDMADLLDAAHRRGIRVISDLVVNHTSDEHAWFQEARRPGSDMRDWYVWSDTPDRYADARIIFIDSEASNWTWDDQAQAYFWHRFYHFQPDLNFDNPDVRQAMLDVVQYWMRMGFDGFRMDAVPYLYEREGTNCENLP